MPKNAGGLDSAARIVAGLALACTMFCPAPSRAVTVSAGDHGSPRRQSASAASGLFLGMASGWH